MPTDIHPEKGISGVEVILLKLHAGAKFSNKDYQFSGGLHGVGVSVVNALSSKRMEVEIKRDGQKYAIAFADGRNGSKGTEVTGTVGQRNTGTTIRFWPDPGLFRQSQILHPSAAPHPAGQSGALPQAARSIFMMKTAARKTSWHFRRRPQRLPSADGLEGAELIPDEPFVGRLEGSDEVVSWAVVWLPEGGETITESYVNLIPTPQGGTHVNGLRSGLLAAIREFCEFGN
jgi:topoisomerase-4 subunit B